LQKETPKLNQIDYAVVVITSMFIFAHVKQYMITGPSYMLSAILGIWVATSLFNWYALWKLRQRG
jgi:KaiC/GvpD/RAD55 family RecA-like ATPase